MHRPFTIKHYRVSTHPPVGLRCRLPPYRKTGTNVILTDTLTPTPVSPDGGTYLLLRSDKRLYLFQTTPAINITWQAKTGLASLFANGFSSSLSEADLQPAIYQIERVRVNTDGTINRFPTEQTIQITATSHFELPKNW